MTVSGLMLRNQRKQNWVFLSIFCSVILIISSFGGSASAFDCSEAAVDLIKPDPRGGIGYQLVYYVDVPLDTYWRFKTDFSGSYLSTNKLIKSHRLIRQEDDLTITETKYTVGPDVTFLWRNKLYNTPYRLEYVLLNSEECDQRFHYGYIEAVAADNRTKVTQVAYFDFSGVSLWAHYPWRGGMKDCLKYAARWEQKTAVRLAWKYETR